jgi:hypothetical protein
MATIIYGDDYTEEEVLKGHKLREHQTEMRQYRGYFLHTKWKDFFELFVEDVSPEESLEFARMCYTTLYNKVISQESWGMGSNSNGNKWRVVAVAHEDAY